MSLIQLGGVVWSAVHGIASLLLFRLTRAEAQAKPRSPDSPTESLQALQQDPDTALRQLMGGLLGTT